MGSVLLVAGVQTIRAHILANLVLNPESGVCTVHSLQLQSAQHWVQKHSYWQLRASAQGASQ